MHITHVSSIEGSFMDRDERVLVVLMRISAVVLLTAIVPAVMPFAWMAATHRLLGMGELPQGPIVHYLTRSLSAMYAMHGAIVYFVSLDVRRFLPVVKCLAVLGIVFGAGMVVLDLAVGMPTPWTACEGPFVIALSGTLLWLAHRPRRCNPRPTWPSSRAEGSSG
jgi:hypothetical protein